MSHRHHPFQGGPGARRPPAGRRGRGLRRIVRNGQPAIHSLTPPFSAQVPPRRGCWVNEYEPSLHLYTFTPGGGGAGAGVASHPHRLITGGSVTGQPGSGLDGSALADQGLIAVAAAASADARSKRGAMRVNLLSPQDARVALPVSCWP